MTEKDFELAKLAELMFQLDQAVAEEEDEACKQLTDDDVSNELRSLGLKNTAPPKSLYRLLGGPELVAGVDEQAEDRRATEPDLSSTVVPLARRKPQLLRRQQQSAGATVRLAASTTRTLQAPGLTKYEGWDIRFGDWVCEFYTDSQHIHVTGLPENEVQELEVSGKSYRLEWVLELRMHRVRGLSRRNLSETMKALQRGDEAAFDVR